MAPDRGLRPGAAGDDPPLSDPAEGNPFLEGQESQTPDERLALRLHESSPNQPGWLVRVVPNQFPAVTGKVAASTSEEGFAVNQLPVCGIHDVVVESPTPCRRLSELSSEQTARVLLAWQRRVLELEQDSSLRSITVFRNEGFSAGASLPHVHSQILALNTTVPQMDVRLQRSAAHRRQSDLSLLQELLEAEIRDETRIVSSDSGCLVMCPWAGRVAWQVRIAPYPVTAVPFSACPESVIIAMAARLHAVTQALDDCAGPRAMNVMLIQPPPEHSDEGWFLDLTPRSTRMAGYELSADVDIVTTAPEAAAAMLRNSMATGTLRASDVIPAGFEWHSST